MRHLVTRPRRRRRWRPATLTWVIVASAVMGLLLVCYPSAAAWLSQLNQSHTLRGYETALTHADPDGAEQLRLAHEYNDRLTAGVELAAGANVPRGSGSSESGLNYDQMLRATKSGLMARLMIPAIDVDLPIYHGTQDDTLLMGIGHLEGSHLPVGGTDSHSVLTAHRGLASARMFTDLDRVRVGDTFSIEVFGEVLSYRVRETRVVEPSETDSLRSVAGQDLVTLITCTPLGINTHRILVTGERVTPTPAADLDRAARGPTVPHFPWWAVGAVGGLGALLLYVRRAGFSDAKL